MAVNRVRVEMVDREQGRLTVTGHTYVEIDVPPLWVEVAGSQARSGSPDLILEGPSVSRGRPRVSVRVRPAGSSLDADGQVVIHNGSTGPVEVIADVQGFYLAGTGAMYQAVSPARVLDTRVGTAANAVRTSLAPGGSLVVRVAGVTGSPVPAGASAVMLNVTVANAQSGGWVSVGPRAVSSSSNLNFTAGATLPNAVVSGLDGNGQVVIYNGSAGTVHVIADLQGYFLTPDA